MLPLEFYLQEDTLSIAKQLLGKRLSTQINGKYTAGHIVETEAYLGPEDKASHAYGNRRTERTAPMFMNGGIAYVYLCYGIHEMFNVVVQEEGLPHAILIRSIVPDEGLDIMFERCRKTKVRGLSDGPGKLCKALGIDRDLNRVSLRSKSINISEAGIHPSPEEIEIGARIGIDYAGEHAALPYRFVWRPKL